LDAAAASDDDDDARVYVLVLVFLEWRTKAVAPLLRLREEDGAKAAADAVSVANRADMEIDVIFMMREMLLIADIIN
jgi:hypothetical protein